MPHELRGPAGWSYYGDQDSELVDETRALMNNPLSGWSRTLKRWRRAATGSSWSRSVNEFKQLDLEKIRGLLKSAVIYDGRNIYDPKVMQELGFTYRSVGR